MKPGCLGCMFLMLVLIGAGFVLGGGLILSTTIFNPPDSPPIPDWTPWDGQRAQQKMAEVILRDTGKSRRADPLVFTEREINAFVALHLEESEMMPFSPLLVRLTAAGIVIQGKTKLKALLKGAPFNYVAESLPASQADREVWVMLRGSVRLEPGRAGKERRALRIEPTRFRIGTQEVSPWLLRWVVGPRLFSWSLPKVIEEVSVEEGRVFVITRTG